MRTIKLLGVVVAALAGAAALVACSETVQPTAVPPVFNPTPASNVAATSTPGVAPTRGPDVGVPAGDASRGQSLFTQNGCSACHTTTGVKLVGPGLAGIYDRAAARVAGLSADAYIEQSIRQPGAFIVPEFPNVMLATFANLPAPDLADLIAYLKTLK